MAWNGSSGASAPQSKKSNGSRAVGKGALAGLLVVVGASAAVYFLMRAPAPVSEEVEIAETSNAIAEVAPDLDQHVNAEAVTTPQVEEVKPPKPRPPQRVGELRDGYRLLPSGKLHRVLGIVTNTPPKMSVSEKTFKHSADVELGHLLMVEPGEDLLGDSEGMYSGFRKELEEALSEPIEYTNEDTELQRELKDGVKELRNELIARMNAGEDVEKIMTDTRNQLKELALYREDLEEQVKRLASTDGEMTQKDYEDLVDAANKMLEERGSKPMELPSSLKRTLRIRQVEEQEREKERKARLNDEQD